MKFAKMVLIALALCMGIVLWLYDENTSDRQADTFCAYDRVFVEITKGKRVWGTILLDDSGVPVHCKDTDSAEQKPSAMKGKII